MYLDRPEVSQKQPDQAILALVSELEQESFQDNPDVSVDKNAEYREKWENKKNAYRDWLMNDGTQEYVRRLRSIIHDDTDGRERFRKDLRMEDFLALRNGVNEMALEYHAWMEKAGTKNCDELPVNFLSVVINKSEVKAMEERLATLNEGKGGKGVYLPASEKGEGGDFWDAEQVNDEMVGGLMCIDAEGHGHQYAPMKTLVVKVWRTLREQGEGSFAELDRYLSKLKITERGVSMAEIKTKVVAEGVEVRVKTAGDSFCFWRDSQGVVHFANYSNAIPPDAAHVFQNFEGGGFPILGYGLIQKETDNSAGLAEEVKTIVQKGATVYGCTDGALWFIGSEQEREGSGVNSKNFPSFCARLQNMSSEDFHTAFVREAQEHQRQAEDKDDLTIVCHQV